MGLETKRGLVGRSSRSLMVAVVLGTALTAMGTEARATAKTESQAITDISKYCTACWRNARLPEDRWGDCTQQVLTRLLERVEQEKWGSILAEETSERKEFLRAIDAVKKRTQRARKYASITPDHADWRNELTDDLRDRREAVTLAACTVLSDRQKQIVELTAGGWGVPEIAAQLGTTVDRVSDEKYKAIRKLRTHFGVE
ncbi:sigma-70 RNA polymerase sigma factor region 4 domain-containing protein [Limnoglobus roseus]|uniref:Sigma-70 family RNA polymerase sigma factor n=1 Tax=Limnoglobus roseus TaxID=2598579 RepID=A0A5C1AQF3_9BACT|nr:sigma-70 family RNA polymerase sigma factor [Limnoglobus roseus]QEL20256.1 sigma-70 family RNA polymerase sigma factor [Limnoglobus roseus]